MTGIIRFETPMEREQFKLDSQQAIVSIFLQLERKCSPVYLLTADGQLGRTRVLHVDTANNRLMLVYTEDSSLNRKAYDEGACFFAEHFGAQIQFFMPSLERTLYEKGYVFSLSIPHEIYRIQRRDSFRAEVPEDNQVDCVIPINGDGPVEMPIADISRGGVALLDRSNTLQIEQGGLLCNCQLRLPKLGVFKTDMQVCNRSRVRLSSAYGEASRIGCKFVSVSRGMENLLQRYIDQLEYRLRSAN